MRRMTKWFAAIFLTLQFVAPSHVSGESIGSVTGGIVTLYALDPLMSTLSFNDGMPGYVVRENLTYNRDSNLAFDIYSKDSFTVAIQGGQKGMMIDLGTADELRTRYGYIETVGNPQGFSSIHLEGGAAFIIKDHKTRTFQPLKEFGALLKGTKWDSSAPIALGHIYLARIFDDHDLEIVVKLKVLTYLPGQAVTIRWERL
ncbi:MAG: hypothetical protein LAO21_10615 [Acidobacteriia bacterium]|nr:hypothetical protein [Terriglobia bacterium]